MKIKTKLIKYIVFIGLSLSGFDALAAFSMRKCMLLPITDMVGGAMSFKVFEEVERYLKDSDWCYYRSNSEIINILSNYKKNLPSHLNNPKVRKVVANKIKAGSIIKVKIINEVKGVDVQMIVYGDNGSDIYFKQSTKLNTSEITIISQTLKNWLEVYKRSIPYTGRIIGVLGNQFTVDGGRLLGFFPGNEVYVRRPTRKKVHPLLKEVVDWDTESIAKAKIVFASENQAQGKILSYDTEKKIRIEDWVILKEPDKVVEKVTSDVHDTEGYEFGKLGTLSFAFGLGSGSTSALYPTSTDRKKIGGFLFGLKVEAEFWATRNLFGGLKLGRRFGSYSKKEGNLVTESNSVSAGMFKVLFGYKYLPINFFYGPQVDIFVGYGKYSYGLDSSPNDGMTEAAFKGLLLGVKGSMPFLNKYRVHLGLDFMPGSKYTEEVAVYGSDDSTSNFHLELGGTYIYAPNINIDASFHINSNKAKFKNPTRELAFKENTLYGGVTFTF